MSTPPPPQPTRPTQPSGPERTPPSGPPEPKGQDLTKDGLLAPATRDPLGRPTLKGISILKKIGQGGMGAVYHARHPRLGIEVAVKVLPFHLADQNPQAIEYFIREARVAARLNHPNLVRVFDVDVDGQIYFLVMEYVRGATAGGLLRERLKAGQGPMPETDVLDLIIPACDALAAAHDEGMIHRDIKPDNIIIPLDEKGLPQFKKAKLMDLGLAKDVGGGGMDLTGTNIAMGTPGYMSPEQAENARTAGPTADVFSMGATLYALMAGAAPFAGTTVLNILRRTADEAHKPIREINPQVSERSARAIDHCLAKDAARRYPNAGKLRDVLKDARAVLDAPATARTVLPDEKPAAKPKPAYQTSPTSPLPAKRSSAGLIVGCVVALFVLLVAGGAGAWWWFSSKDAPFRELMAKGAACEARQDWEGAAKAYEEAGDRPEAREKLAAVRAKMGGDYDKVFADAKKALDAGDFGKAEELARKALAMRKTPEAEDLARNAAAGLAGKGKYADALRAGRRALSAKEWDDAIRQFTIAMEGEATANDAITGMEKARRGKTVANALVSAREKKRSDPEGAWKVLRSAIAQYPDDYDLRLEAARLALEAKMSDEYGLAVDDATTAVASAPDAAGKQAAEAVKKDLEEARRGLGAIAKTIDRIQEAMDKGDLDEAEKLVATLPPPMRRNWAEKMRPVRAFMDVMTEGERAEKESRLDEALAKYEKADSIAPPRGKQRAADAIRRVKEKQVSQAQLAVAQAAQRAREALRAGDTKKASGELETLRRLAPNHAEIAPLTHDIALAEAKALEQKGDGAGAVAAAQRALQVRPDSAEAKEIVARLSASSLLADAKAALAAGRRAEAAEKARAAAKAGAPADEIAKLEAELWPELLKEAAKSAHDGPVDEIVLSADGATIYAAGPGFGGVGAWKSGDLSSVARAARGGSRVHSIAPLPAQRKLAALAGDPFDPKRRGAILVYDLGHLEGAPTKLRMESLGIDVQASGLAASPDGRGFIRVLFTTGGREGPDFYSLDLIDAAGTRLGFLDQSPRAQGHARMAISNDGASWASAGGTYSTYTGIGQPDERDKLDPNVYLRAFEGGGQAKTPLAYDADAGEVRCMRFSSDGRWLAAGTAGGRVFLFDVRARRRDDASFNLGGAIASIACDGKRLAAVVDGKVKIITIDTRAVGEAPGGRAKTVEFLPEDKGLIVGGDDGRLRKYVPQALK